MDLSAIIKAVTVPRFGHEDRALEFQPGDKLTGRVLQLDSDGRALIDLGGPRVTARMDFDVKQGQTLRLTVVESGRVLHLRTEPPPGQSAQVLSEPVNPGAALTSGERQTLIETLKTVLTDPAVRSASVGSQPSVVQAMRHVLSLFDPLPIQEPTAKIAHWLRNAMENHGSLFEKRLADTLELKALPEDRGTQGGERRGEAPVRAIITRDIKSQLIILKQALAETDAARMTALVPDGKTRGLLGDSVDKMLRHVEQQQTRAVVRSGDGDPMQWFQHLFPLSDGKPPLQLKVYYPRKDRRTGAGTTHRIALLLDMDQLGPVRGDIAKVEDVLQVGLFVQNEAVRKHFLDQLGDIEKALGNRFRQVSVSVSVSREKISDFHQEDARGAAPGRIDIKA